MGRRRFPVDAKYLMLLVFIQVLIFMRTALLVSFSSIGNGNLLRTHMSSDRREKRVRDMLSSRVILQKPTSSNLQRLVDMEQKLGRAIHQKVVSCKKEYLTKSNHTDSKCGAYIQYLYNNKNVTDVETIQSSNFNFYVYNPLRRDQFLCGEQIIVGPEKNQKLTIEDMKKCSHSISQSHSFPYPPTFENRGDFPGILVTRNQNRKPDDTFSSDTIKSMKPNLQDETRACDVKCKKESNGWVGGIYGMEARFTNSMEGEVG